MKMVDYALRYLVRGFAVVPATGKQPIANWKQYQNALPKEDEVRRWWVSYPDANIALVTGAISGVVVVDVDGETQDKFGLTPTVRTSPLHYHYYYAHPGGVIPCSTKVVGPYIDVRGDGGIAILPPSIHYNERGRPDGQYSWVTGPKAASFAPLPEWILEKVKVRQPMSELVKGSDQGARNVNTTSVVGSLLAKYSPKDWESVCWPLIVAYNAQSNRPPLGEGELRTIFESIAGRQLQSYTQPHH